MAIVEQQQNEMIVAPATLSSLAELNRSEIDTQVATAHAYPRSMRSFKRKAMEMATLDEDTAGTMFYVLPGRKKKDGTKNAKAIEGPSCPARGSDRAHPWGNLRYGARIVQIEERFVTAQGICHDLENNSAGSVEIKRSIWGEYGRYSDNMIQTTCNAAISIALREAIFRIVPRSLFNDIYEAARQTSIGKAQSMASRRASSIQWFVKAGATEAQVLAVIGKKGIDDIDTDDLIALRGMATAIKDGETTIDEALDLEPKKAPGLKRSTLQTPSGTKVEVNEHSQVHDESPDPAQSPVPTETAPGPRSEPVESNGIASDEVEQFFAGCRTIDDAAQVRDQLREQHPKSVRMIDRYHAARVGDLSRRKKPAVQETLLEKGSPQA